MLRRGLFKYTLKLKSEKFFFLFPVYFARFKKCNLQRENIFVCVLLVLICTMHALIRIFKE